MPAAVTLYGAPADVSALGTSGRLDSGQSFATVPVSGFAFEAGATSWYTYAQDGKVVVGTMEAHGNQTMESFVDATIYVFTPATGVWQEITLTTSTGHTGVTGAVNTNGFGACEIDDVFLANGRVCAVSAFDYRGWRITGGSGKGKYPAWIVLNSTLTGIDAALSKTTETLRTDAVSGGASAFPAGVNSFSEAYNLNKGMCEAETLPNGWVIVAFYYFTAGRSGGLGVFNATGVLQGFYQFPNLQFADGTTIDYSPRDIAVDPSSTSTSSLRFTVIGDAFRAGTSTRAPFTIQEFAVNATVSPATITPISAPVMSAGNDEAALPKNYTGTQEQVLFDAVGTCWVANGTGGTFTAQALAGWKKTGAERRWATEAPPSAGWENRYGEFRLLPDIQLGATASNLLTRAMFNHTPTGGVLVVGSGGKVAPFVPDVPLADRPNLVTNSSFVSNVTGWSNLLGSGAVTWDAGDSGRLVLTATGGAYTNAAYQSPVTALPVGSVGQSGYGWVRFKAATTLRSVRARLVFLDVNGNQIGSQTNGPYTIETAGAYVKVVATGEVPATATHYQIYGEVVGTPATGEIHYTDSAYLSLSPVTHRADIDLELSSLPLAPATGRWPARGGVDTSDQSAWLPVVQHNSSGSLTMPVAMPQYLIRLDLAQILTPSVYQATLGSVTVGAGTAYEWREAPVGLGFANVRRATLERAGRHGSRPARSLLSDRMLRLPLLVNGEDEDDAMERLDVLIGQWQPTDTAVPLFVRMPGWGDGRFVWGQPGRAEPDLDRLPKATVVDVDLEWIGTDPLFYSVTEYTTTIAPAGAANLTNAGTANAPWTAIIDGPVDGPKLTRGSRSLDLDTLVLVAGETALLDSATRTVTVAGVTVYHETSASRWWDLLPGTNNVAYVVDSGTGSVTFFYRSAWPG